MSTQQRPLELILARNLISSLSTPAFLVDAGGQIIFFNDAVSPFIGRRFEETGAIPHERWRATVGPFDEHGEPIPYRDLPLTQALIRGVACHHKHLVRVAGADDLLEYEVSGVPLVAAAGAFHGAMVFLWASSADGSSTVPGGQ